MVAVDVTPKYTGIVTTSQVADRTFVLDLSTPTVNIQNFVYDIRSGLSTVTTVSDHGFQVGMGVTLAGIGLTCEYGTKNYPDGKVGYIFEVHQFQMQQHLCKLDHQLLLVLILLVELQN